MPINHSRRKRNGFTIVEIMVALAITGFVLVGFYSVVLQVIKSSIVNEQRSEQTQKVRSLVDHFYHEARSVERVITSKKFTFEFERRKMDGDLERLRYEWDDDNEVFKITNVTDGTSKIPLDSIGSMQFTYKNRHGDPATTALEANAVQITFFVTQNKQIKTEKVKVQTPLIAFRNKKYPEA